MNKKRLIIGLTLIFILFTLGNLLFLDYRIFFPKSESLSPSLNSVDQFLSQSSSPSPTINPSPALTRLEVEELIKQATASLKPQIVKEPQSQASISNLGAGEFSIYLGSGTGSSDDWADLPGVEAYIDSTKYNQIKNVVFEAAINIPTGNETVWVRLFNVTDKHPVWFSEVSLEGGTPKLLISKPITLNEGQKLYRAQMKTSLKYQASLTSSRVKITTY